MTYIESTAHIAWRHGERYDMTHALTYRGPSLTALHEEYAKAHRIDERAPLAGRRQIVVDAPVDRVWRTLTDVLAWDTNLEPGVKDIRLENGVTVDSKFVRSNKGARMTARFAVVKRDRELAWTGQAFGAKVVHRFELTPRTDETTDVLVQESMAGPLLALVFNTRKLTNLLEESLHTLKSAAESAA